MVDETRFEAACARALLRKAEGGGIGMLGEKSLHSALKYYYEPDEGRHEQPVNGFVADILNERGITEIQTGGLFALRRKLAAYGGIPVTVVHPIVRRRSLIYLDPASGELSRPRLSPKKGRVEDAFSGLVHIREELKNPLLTVTVPVLDAEEYRIANGAVGRRGPRPLKYELVPVRLAEEYPLSQKADHLALLPEGLPNGFTVKELARAQKLPERTASAMCAVMLAVGALSRRREGRAYVYMRED
ncbi:MAG: hypothetical protein II124_06060 [Clostridia bacterium]|nr:hypothetical protein [Clostridia bacterium]